ncbi:multidrug effflux MFS transporter [Paraburkholderia sp. Ac-20340]|uniref:multidrug effflux MFS transporter n=1 Tax=Paraburkholderia sp. Ac-20340 TaxID=2703888 RepID=UPI001F11CF6D|nr:multidrug effflux MFS transporter [Paraburkholderia sp. Ac-20340]
MPPQKKTNSPPRCKKSKRVFFRLLNDEWDASVMNGAPETKMKNTAVSSTQTQYAPAFDESTSHPLRILLILSALMAFASISTDLYLPAMPEMARNLHASDGEIELTVSGFLVGFSLGQLVWGVISDRWGRRLPITLGLVLFIIGSIGCSMSHSAVALIAWRIVQAIGACANVVLARAMVRDLYAGHRAASMMSTLITIMAVAPLIGPSVGGQILIWSSWRAIFWTLVVVGILTLLSLIWLPETHPVERRNQDSLIKAFLRYGELLANGRIMGYAGVGALFYGAIYAYIAGTPFAYITYYHVPPHWYGILFGVGIAGIMATNMINARIVRRYRSDAILTYGCIGAALAACVLFIDGLSDFGGLWGLVIPLFVIVSSTGFVVANAIAGALHVAPERAGSLSAFIGATQYGTGIVGSGLVGFFADGTPVPMVSVIAALCIGCAACALFILKKNKGA